MIFEPRHENKSCSACRERVNESSESSESKVVKVKVFQVYQIIPGSQLLSDIFLQDLFFHFVNVR